ncbi:MAG: associated Golgi protein-related protein [Acidobacteriaceae bacterium]|nr:associated Golgi protein-related protein [Acidobacteriaceae bacterium]
MLLAAATLLHIHPIAVAAADMLAQPGAHQNPMLHFLFQFGLIGIFLVSIVDSSFVPLPLPGITDLMIVVLAAQHENWFLLIAVSTLGSALGGYFSYHVGHAGGMAFLEKHVPPRIFKRVTGWMEDHAILAVALPAILPPPMPLSPFVLAAGALNMSRNKFLSTFTISRAIRHSVAAWLGIHYGRHILRVWNMFSEKWGTTILIVLWTGILLSCGFAFWKLYKTRQALGEHPKGTTPEAA